MADCALNQLLELHDRVQLLELNVSDPIPLKDVRWRLQLFSYGVYHQQVLLKNTVMKYRREELLRSLSATRDHRNVSEVRLNSK